MSDKDELAEAIEAGCAAYRAAVADEDTFPGRIERYVEYTVRPLFARQQATITAEIQAERTRQDNKWGERNHRPERWLMILAEEVGEANRAALEGSLLQYRDELMQVAAVACAAIECLDRDKWGCV